MSVPRTTVAGKVFSYADDATAQLIEQSQLGLPGRTTFLTPNGNLSPLQAQIELALPQKNRGWSVKRPNWSIVVEKLSSPCPLRRPQGRSTRSRKAIGFRHIA